MIGRTRPGACPEGHPVRRRGDLWWCWTCDREVPSREPPTPKLARKRMAPVGPERKRAARRLRAYGTDERLAWLHSLPCVAANSPWHVCDPWDMETGRAVIQAVHVRARGAGGGADDQVPGCAAFHREAGEYGTTARRLCEARHGLDLVDLAAEYAARWREVAQQGAAC